MKVNTVALQVWLLMIIGIWSTYYFQTLLSPIIFSLMTLAIIFAELGLGEQNG